MQHASEKICVETSGPHAKQGQLLPNSEDFAFAQHLSWYAHMCKVKFKFGVQVDGCNSQPRRDSSGWEVLSLEEVLDNLNRVTGLPSVENVICILQKCRKRKNIQYAKRVYTYICVNGLETHKTVGNYVVPMLVECGSISHAQQVFDRLDYKNEHSWTSLISGYSQCGQWHHAFNLYQKMKEDNVHPSRYTLIAILKSCARLKDVERGRQIHDEIMKRGFHADLFVGNTLLDMYAKCGSLSEAREVFDRLPVQDVVSWTTLIAGYAEHGPGQEALNCFELMQLEGVYPNAVTYTCALKACGNTGAIDKGREIHMEAAHKGFEKNMFVGNTLVDMYAKCGSLSEAQKLFDKLLVRDIVSWTVLIAGYAAHGSYQEVLHCFEQMQLEGIPPNAVTFVRILKACGSVRAIDKGREICTEVVHKGFERNLFVGNTLIDMFAKCGSLLEARAVFDKLPVRDVVSWNALIAGYAENGYYHDAVKCFEQMQLEGASPDEVTFMCVLKACGKIGAIEKGREIHSELTHKGFEKDMLVGNTSVDMYAKCGALSEAQEVFSRLPAPNIVSWNALIAGYAQHGPVHEAVKCFEQMQLNHVCPDPMTFVCLLKACGSMGAIGKGREIHAEITKKGFERDLFIGSSLVDMYAKCGSLSEAWDIFGKLPVRDVVSWNALISGYGMNHEGDMAIQCFQDMQEQGVKPNAVTFACLITACSHSSLVFKGQDYFKVMRKEYGIVPTIDHCTSMVDLLARSGNLYEAENFLETMPCPPSIKAWTALLSACKSFQEVELGLKCFKQLVKVDPEYAVPYVLMVNILTNAGRKDDAYRIEQLRKLAGAKKKPASALIEVNKKIHEFVVGTNQSKEISAMLEILNSHMQEEGHVPNLDLVLHPISDYDKEVNLCEHAEKLALAFGLLNTPQRQTLHVTKNMRMCNNCHDANKIISKIEKREIIVRDGYCVHHFKDGFCSCRALF